MDKENTKQLNSKNHLPGLVKVGEVIRKARELKGLSTADLADSIRISKGQLVALETADNVSLPEEVFIKGMIKRIADRLELDAEALITDLINQEEHSNKKENSTKNIYKMDQKSIFIGGSILSLFAIIFLISSPSNQVQKPIQSESENKGDVTSIERDLAGEEFFHIVKYGETLTTIAEYYGIPVGILIQINEINNPNALEAGSKLRLILRRAK